MDSEDKKMYLILALLIIGIIGCFAYFFNGLNKAEKEAKSNVGKNIIIKNDTLMVVDYSIIRQVYILDNGLEVSPSLVEKK